MTVLVTGASGHVGLTLVQRLLAQGRRVRTLSRYRASALGSLPIEFVDGDLGEKDSLRAAFADVEVVYHAAAHISLQPNAWPALQRANVEGTRHVVELCHAHHVRRLLYFSSLEVLRSEPRAESLNETRPLIADDAPLPYARSKVLAQYLVQHAIQRGLDAVMLYPSAILGPNDYRANAANALVLMLARGELPALVHGGYDWVDVRDVVEGAMRAERDAPAGGAYILSNQWVSLQGIGRMVAEAGGSPAPRLVIPAWVGYLCVPAVRVAASLRGKTPTFTKHALYTATNSNQRVSHQRATDELAYQPRPLAQTVADTLDWFERIGRFSRRRKQAAR